MGLSILYSEHGSYLGMKEGCDVLVAVWYTNKLRLLQDELEEARQQYFTVN